MNIWPIPDGQSRGEAKGGKWLCCRYWVVKTLRPPQLDQCPRKYLIHQVAHLPQSPLLLSLSVHVIPQTPWPATLNSAVKKGKKSTERELKYINTWGKMKSRGGGW